MADMFNGPTMTEAFDLYVEAAGDDEAVVTLCGALDAVSVAEFQSAVLALAAGGVDRVALDMAGVEFIDSTGLGAVIGLLERLEGREGGGELVLRRPSAAVTKVLDITGLLDVLTVEA